MDDTDRRLISLLRKDARLSVATLADKLGVSRGTVTKPWARLHHPRWYREVTRGESRPK